MHLHILGICGTFMGGIAALAQQQGHTITGCDAHTYPPMSTQLEALGITLTSGYDAEQLDSVARDADVFVIGNALSRGNPLVEAILERNLPYTSGAQWLAEHVLRAATPQGVRHVLAVAGTHGKTTTASMLAWILDCAGYNPGFLIGGVPAGFQTSARLTDSPFFVIEADEYDTAFFDKRSKFVHYRPRTAILNNLEFDHADIFADLAAIETQFHHLVRCVPSGGLIIVNAESEALQRVLAQGVWSRIERFGSSSVTPPPEWQLSNTTNGGDLTLITPDNTHKKWALPQPGTMNAMNALAALAAARHVGVDIDEALAALARFPGVARRLERRGHIGGITVYDDFAHHPTAIAATLDALRSRIGNTRLLAVLEPRSNTMKLGTMKAALPDSLRQADAVYCYAAHLDWDAAAALAPLGEKARTFDTMPTLLNALSSDAQEGDHVLIMSNGSFDGIHQKLMDRIESQRAQG